MSKNANFQQDQYFYLDRSSYETALKEINELVDSDVSGKDPYERVWIPENQVTGQLKKIDQDTFLKVERIFNESLLPTIEENTGLSNLELVGVRKNTLNSGDLVSAHGDTLGYVLLIDIPDGSSVYEGGNVIFKKDDDEVVELGIEANDLLVAKCTNEHGVSRVTKGQRESLAFFAKPRD